VNEWQCQTFEATRQMTDFLNSRNQQKAKEREKKKIEPHSQDLNNNINNNPIGFHLFPSR
jgi:hypothetical protein